MAYNLPPPPVKKKPTIRVTRGPAKKKPAYNPQAAIGGGGGQVKRPRATQAQMPSKKRKVGTTATKSIKPSKLKYTPVKPKAKKKVLSTQVKTKGGGLATTLYSGGGEVGGGGGGGGTGGFDGGYNPTLPEMIGGAVAAALGKPNVYLNQQFPGIQRAQDTLSGIPGALARTGQRAYEQTIGGGGYRAASTFTGGATVPGKAGARQGPPPNPNAGAAPRSPTYLSTSPANFPQAEQSLANVLNSGYTNPPTAAASQTGSSKSGGGGYRSRGGGGYRSYGRSNYRRSYRRSYSRGYSRRSYGGYSSGGGGGGGGGGGATANADEYGKFGIPKEYMEAYRAFWGQDQPKKQWSLYQPVMELFSRTLGRMPQVTDWQQMWQMIKDEYAARTPAATFPNPYANLTRYEPIVQSLLPAPLFTPPQTSYAPGLSF